MDIPITHRFSVAAEIQAAMAFLATDASQTVSELKETESALKDRRRDMDDTEFYAARDQLRDAADTVKQHIRDDYAEDWQVNWNTGILLSRLGRDKAAMEFLERAHEQNPTDAHIPRKMAHALVKLHKNDTLGGHLPRAIGYAEKAIEIDGHPESHEMLGDVYFAGGQHENSFRSFAAASDLYEEQGLKSNGYAERRASEILRRHLYRKDEAVPYAEDAYDLGPGDRRNIEELGYAYSDAGEHDRAIPHLMHAHFKRPQMRVTLLKLHDSLLETGAYNEAMEFAKRLDTHADARTLSLVKQLRVAESTPRFARESRQIAADLEREASASDFDAARALGGYYFAHGEYERALPLLKRVSADPRGQSYLNRTAQTMRELGDFAGSEAFVRTAMSKDPENPPAILAAGWHAHDTDQLQLAAQCAELIRQKAPDYRAASAFLTVMSEVSMDADWTEQPSA